MNATLTKLNSLVRRYPHLAREIWYYEMEIKQFNHSIYPNLPNTTMVGYDGISPGPTIIVPKGTESIVRFVNNSPRKNSVHLHGSFSRAPFDGFAEDTTDPGQYKDYYFPNQQNGRTIWYHDHATAENAYMGQAGMYIIKDPAEDALNLPSGYGVYDIPLVLTAKRYNPDGSLYSTIGEQISLYGDVIHVNGQPWPVFDVEPRKYRFRILNAAVSRSFSLYLVDLAEENRPIRFQVIGSDSGLLEKPVWTPHLYLSMAERYEIILDFTNYTSSPSTVLELRNFRKAGGAGVEEEYAHTNQIMRFRVTPPKPSSSPDTSIIPSHLRDIPYPDPTTNPGFPGRQNKTIHHHFKFHRANGTWLINNTPFSDIQNRVLAKPPRNTVEIWELENTTDGWSHPIHIHLVDFRVLHRSGSHFFDSAPRNVQPYEKHGLKDVVWLGKEEKVWVEAHYAPWDGVYMFHCHNLVHEDDDMMGVFNVTGLIDAGLGYTDQDFIDPLEPKWRARRFDMLDFRQRKGLFSEVGIQLRVWDMSLRDPYLFGRLPAWGGGLHRGPGEEKGVGRN
ncbi:putative bilirubin oxidase precursor [Rhypophila decipiens]